MRIFLSIIMFALTVFTVLMYIKVNYDIASDASVASTVIGIAIMGSAGISMLLDPILKPNWGTPPKKGKYEK